jgi:hypothetical protein
MGRGSRFIVVAMLVAAELVIVGLGLQAIGIGGRPAWFARAGVAPAGRTVATLAAGAAPRITIDDPDSAIVVSPSHDGLVHVQDATARRGWGFSSSAPWPRVSVVRTPDGVQITRPAYDFGFARFSREETDLQVPSGAAIEIAHCQTADVAGVQGGVDIRAQDGHIGLRDVGGPSILASTDDGHILATDLRPLGSNPRVVLHSDDGHIDAGGLFPANGNYEITTSDGHINLSLASGSDVSIEASTDDGSVRVDGERNRSGAIRLSGGSSPMRVRTEDGAVRITTNGAP